MHSLEPIPENTTAAREEQFLVSQGNLWKEYIATVDQTEYMVLPRMAALSEVVLSQKKSKDWTNFHERLPHWAQMNKDYLFPIFNPKAFGPIFHFQLSFVHYQMITTPAK